MITKGSWLLLHYAPRILFFFFLVPGIERRGILPPCYTLGPIFYTLFYFILFIYFFAVLGIECGGVLPPRYAPGPIFFYALF